MRDVPRSSVGAKWDKSLGFTTGFFVLTKLHFFGTISARSARGVLKTTRRLICRSARSVMIRARLIRAITTCPAIVRLVTPRFSIPAALPDRLRVDSSGVISLISRPSRLILIRFPRSRPLRFVSRQKDFWSSRGYFSAGFLCPPLCAVFCLVCYSFFA